MYFRLSAVIWQHRFCKIRAATWIFDKASAPPPNLERELIPAKPLLKARVLVTGHPLCHELHCELANGKARKLGNRQRWILGWGIERGMRGGGGGGCLARHQMYALSSHADSVNKRAFCIASASPNRRASSIISARFRLCSLHLSSMLALSSIQ